MIKGLSLKSTNGLGTLSVNRRRRMPKPLTRMRAFMALGCRVVEGGGGAEAENADRSSLLGISSGGFDFEAVRMELDVVVGVEPASKDKWSVEA